MYTQSPKKFYERMDDLLAKIICFVVATTFIQQQLAEGYPSSDIDGTPDPCTVPTDIVIPSTNSRCSKLARFMSSSDTYNVLL